MHELSLVRSLMTQVEQIVAQNGGGVVRQVVVQIGPLSGVEGTLVLSAWKQLSLSSSLHNAVLEIEEVPLLARCQSCKVTFEPVHFCFYCPTCGDTQSEVVSGDGVILHSIVLKDAKQGAVA